MKRPAPLRHLLLALPLLAALSVSMTGCTPHGERERLQRAEEVIETDAAAAAATLDSIRPSSLHGDARARYALLRTQSDYKNFVPLTSDSLIRIATRRYGTRRPSADAALAQYYLGCTYKDMGRDLDAIDALLRATTLFPDTTNKYYAYSHSELGLLYLNHHSPSKAIPVLEKYGAYGRNVGDSTIIGKADYHLGRAFLRLSEVEKAKDAFHRVMSNSAINSSFKEGCLYNLAKQAFYTEKDRELSEQYINQYLQAYPGGYQIGPAYVLKGDIEHAAFHIDSAYYYYQRALVSNDDYATKCVAYKGLSEIAPYLLQQDSVAGYIQKYTVYLDSVYVQSHQQEIEELNANHIIELHDREMAARHQHFKLGSILGLLLLLALIAFAFSARDRKRQQAVLQLEAELRESNARQMEASLPDESSPHSVMERGQLMAIYRQKMETSTYLFRTKRGHNLLDEATFKDRELEMSECQAIEDDFYTCFTDIIRDLTLECPKINKQEVYLCLCSSLGYPTKVIASLLSRSEATIRSQKTRLKAKLPADIYHLFFFD